MSSLFEEYGLALHQTQDNDSPRSINHSNKRAIENASKEIGKNSLSPTQSQVASLLERVRELDWTTKIARELKTEAQRSAALLHCRGKSVEPCSHCAQGGPWSTCVVFPVYQGQSMYSYACSNCVYYHRAIKCSHRQAFEAQGGRNWDPAITESIVANGGLRSVLTKDHNNIAPVMKVTSPAVPKKRKQSAECAAPSQAQTQMQANTTQIATPKKTIRLQSKSAFDGEKLPWPVSPASWNDPIKLRSAIKDLETFTQIAKKRVARLDEECEAMSTADFWNQEAAKLFS
ncbi:DUF3716 domain-containing protein [Aspergillus mulundensis]|uniref:Copper-fist domain-containing protein n=1 Tax=Aspergillus mulundensis TaxID=1810919 RepID=A0A3D8SLC7_9EURO|nr:hypothetical protein DSM5745_03781 [Aspergillus mulundensis]RDW87139.1 hypothetical protein DSM5745_03781 [Aspergillus mulundensis]